MWQALDKSGTIRGRIRGISFPGPNSEFVVWTEQGLFSIICSQTAFVSKLAHAEEAERLFDPVAGVIARRNVKHLMYGDCGLGGELLSRPTRMEHPGGDRLVPDPETESLLVLGAGSVVRQTIPDFRLSAGWAVAGFSRDGELLVVADPVDVRVFKYATAKGTEKPRWTAMGNATDQGHLFRAVMDNPDEDVPRLMYADWLEEHGDSARAEFIRLQCRLAVRMREESVTNADPDQRRANELTELLGVRWLAELPKIRGVHWSGFWRGFAGARVASPTTLVRSGRKVWAATPLEMVTVNGLNAAGGRSLADSPYFDRIRVLTVERYFTPRDGLVPILSLFHSPRAAGLRRLAFNSYLLREDAVMRILDSPHLTGLEWLDLGINSTFGDNHATVLLASRTFANLRAVKIRNNRLTIPMKVKLLARFPHAFRD